MSSNHLILCHPLLLLPSIFPSIRVFSNESVLRIRWPKYWNWSFSINEYWLLPMNIQGWLFLELTGLISLQSKGLSRVFSSTIVQKHQFCGAQLSLRPNSYMGTKSIVLTIRTFAGEVMSLLNMLFSFVIAFLPRGKTLLISWQQSLSTMILKPKKVKSITVSIVSPSICMKWWDQVSGS